MNVETTATQSRQFSPETACMTAIVAEAIEANTPINNDVTEMSTGSQANDGLLSEGLCIACPNRDCKATGFVALNGWAKFYDTDTCQNPTA